MADTDQFSTQEIFAMTLIGESESLGESGMVETACTILNRAKANLRWMGGSDIRTVCLSKGQYDCWWPVLNNPDRTRVIQIALNNTAYAPYFTALTIAGSAIAGNLEDITNGAVSYYDSNMCGEPYWAEDAQPCYTSGKRFFYDLATITRPAA
jgi:N-acetylmuramoyl-L-alanine amidase